MKGLKALTLSHPWPWTFTQLPDQQAKRIENRTWTPPRALIGQYFALHGGRVPSARKDLDNARQDALFIANEILEVDSGEPALTAEDLPDEEVIRLCIPGIFAVARLKEVVTASDDPWFFGPFGWVLEDLVQIDPPVAHKGAQGLWEIEAAALELVRERFRTARRQGLPAVVEPEAAGPVTEAEPVPTQPAGATLPVEERARLIGEVLLLDTTRDVFWSLEQVQEKRRAGLKALTDAELLAERAHYRRFYEGGQL